MIKRYLGGSLELPLYAESTGETPEDILEVAITLYKVDKKFLPDLSE
ncbi:hypothetical protein ACR71G_03550 [Xenorhabdus bovienii]